MRFFIFCLFLNLPMSFASVTTCTSTREYVTTLEFIRSQKVFSISEDEARKIADQVSAQCTGAGLRFIQTFELLSRSGLLGKDALSLSLEMAKKTQPQSQMFLTLFRKLFLSEELDLELQSSVGLAKDFIQTFKGEVGILVEKDFDRFSSFCMGKKGGVFMPHAECAQFALRLSQLSFQFKEGAFFHFQKIYEFLSESSLGPKLITAQALGLTEKILSYGQEAQVNFEQAYRYAVSEKGLKLPVQEAVKFAENLTVRSKLESQP